MSEIKEKSAALLNTSKENRSHISYLGLYFTNFLDVKSPRTEAVIYHMFTPLIHIGLRFINTFIFIFFNLAKASY